jgi:23S rRNA pseudouridine1911/1915/1917 synthase
MEGSSVRTLRVPAADAGMRLDAFLAHHVPHCSRRTAQRVIAAGEVRVNGRRVRKAHTVAADDAVSVPEELYEAPHLQANPQLAVPILYEDASLVAIDKPAGMPSHALRADETETVANFLLARYPELAHVGTDREPGIVHRLDTDTSGVLLAARTTPAYRALRRQFSTHRVRKEYVAVTHGDVAASGEVRAPIAHDRHNRRKMRVCRAAGSSAGARPAVTRYAPLDRLGGYTVLAVEIPTGVMHQIRAHLASIGHPIVGDRLYGAVARDGDPPRHLLHATRLTVVHPASGRPLTIESPPPAEFRAFIAALRGTRQAFSASSRKARQSEPTS